MDKYYKIAGFTVKMESFPLMDERGKDYEIDPVENPDICLQWPYEKLIDPEKYPLSLEERLYLGTGGEFYKKLMLRQGLMIHSSAVVVDNKAYLFSADSGVGKSTHTQLWLDHFGDRAYLLNDDKPALRLEDGQWFAYGTPWSGKNGISRNRRVPLGGIAILERGERNEIRPFGGLAAAVALIKQTERTRMSMGQELILENIDRLVSQAKIWKLRCNMEPEAAIVAYEAMSK